MLTQLSTFFRYSVNSLLRRKLRSLITIAGVASAVAVLYSLLAFQRGYQLGLSRELEKLGAHLLVVPKGCPYDAASIALHGANWPCYLPSKYLTMVTQTQHVAEAAPVLMTAFYDDATQSSRVYCGVLPNILALKKQWTITGSFPKTGEALTGMDIASKNHWTVGQTVKMADIQTPVKISGILNNTQGPDDQFVFIPLGDAQTDFKHADQFTHILVKLDHPDHLEEVVRSLRGCEAGLEMNIVPLAHVFKTIQGLISSTRLLLACVTLAALFAAAIGLSNTVFMSVTERTREIGVLRAMGTERSNIFALVWMETLIMSLIGAAVGLLGATLFEGLVETWLRARLPFVPNGPLMSYEWTIALLAIAAAAIIGGLAGLAPSMRAAGLSPVEAIRRAEGGV